MVKDSFVVWDQANMEELVERLYTETAAHIQSFVDYDEWSEEASAAKKAGRKIPSMPYEPSGAFCDVKEFGFDWKRGDAFMCTEINGTHADFLTIKSDNVELWLNPEATAKKIIELTCAFPGWRHIYCEGFRNIISFQLHGGWFE